MKYLFILYDIIGNNDFQFYLLLDVKEDCSEGLEKADKIFLEHYVGKENMNKISVKNTRNDNKKMVTLEEEVFFFYRSLREITVGELLEI